MSGPFLPGYDAWKTYDPQEDLRHSDLEDDQDPDIAREDRIERERLRDEDR